MIYAIAKRPFTRSDTKEPVRVGEEIYGELPYINELCRNGLARRSPQRKVLSAPETKARPCVAVGEDQALSASPAAQASPQTSAKPSKRGGKRKKKETPDE